MNTYMYKKTTQTEPEVVTHRPGRLKRLTPAILITLGSILMANVAWPIINYQFFVSPQLQRTELLSPINELSTAYFSPLASSNEPVALGQTAQILGQDLDYTKATNWFPAADFQQSKESKITHYTIDIPTLDIDDAIVEIGGDDLSKHLIQYPGTSNPGELGSPVLFGHSVLRQFYNPSINNPRRYMSIFSKIMTLEDGDEIFVSFDGIRYKYTVVEKAVVNPEDVFILQQRHDRRELKLITCVPEGTYLQRGVVIAQLQDIN